MLAAATSAGYPCRHNRVLRTARGGATIGKRVPASTDSIAIPPGSIEELQRETRVMCALGFEVKPELTPPLPLARSVGDDDLDHAILDLVGNAAPTVEEVP